MIFDFDMTISIIASIRFFFKLIIVFFEQFDCDLPHRKGCCYEYYIFVRWSVILVIGACSGSFQNFFG